MNLSKLLEMQKALDERIVKEKGLEGQDLFPNTVLALQVELAEFAQEGRWFKHWSDDQEPRTKTVCSWCQGKGRFEYCWGEHDDCFNCHGTGKTDEQNPLLEEFVDGVHFFLSIANQKGWQDALYIHEESLDKEDFDGDLTGWYLEMVYFLNKAYMEKHSNEENLAGFQKNAFYFRMAWVLFLNLGINGFGFSLEQIEAAYEQKNEINHKRQEHGY